MRSEMTPSIDLIVPVFNEQACIEPFFVALQPVMTALDCDWRVIFINDGSDDETLTELHRLKAENSNVKIISFARNFGKEAALTAGLDHCKADVIVPIDVDLQDPPDLIAVFLQHWRDGHDIVYGVRQDRLSDGFVKRTTAGLFYQLFNRLSDTKIPANAGDFRLMDRRVVLQINQLRERNRFMKGLMAWPGFKTLAVPFERGRRSAGDTTWNYWRLIKFALSGIFSFSALPLRIWLYLGCCLAVFSLLYAIIIVVRVLIFGVDVPGYASIMVAVVFMGGIQLMTLGIIGEYLSRVFDEVKGRPIYVVDKIED